eukprot:7747651-Alexandrium_andersonii.AAC.1
MCASSISRSVVGSAFPQSRPRASAAQVPPAGSPPPGRRLPCRGPTSFAEAPVNTGPRECAALQSPGGWPCAVRGGRRRPRP